MEALEGFYRYFVRYERVTGESFYSLPAAKSREEGARDPGGDAFLSEVNTHRAAFLEAMDDDFNTGGAIGTLFQLLPVLNRYIVDSGLENAGDKPAEKLAKLKQGTQILRELTAILGLFREPVKPAAVGGELAGKLVELLVELRQTSRAAKDYATGDTIRKSLGELGVTLEDRAGKTEHAIKGSGDGLAEKLVTLIVGLRKSVREQKNFALSDKLRDQLAGLGVLLEDHSGETTWTIKA
jgi:cysteinyl-tRNA synthetase